MATASRSTPGTGDRDGLTTGPAAPAEDGAVDPAAAHTAAVPPVRRRA